MCIFFFITNKYGHIYFALLCHFLYIIYNLYSGDYIVHCSDGLSESQRAEFIRREVVVSRREVYDEQISYCTLTENNSILADLRGRLIEGLTKMENLQVRLGRLESTGVSSEVKDSYIREINSLSQQIRSQVPCVHLLYDESADIRRLHRDWVLQYNPLAYYGPMKYIRSEMLDDTILKLANKFTGSGRG